MGLFLFSRKMHFRNSCGTVEQSTLQAQMPILQKAIALGQIKVIDLNLKELSHGVTNNRTGQR